MVGERAVPAIVWHFEDTTVLRSAASSWLCHPARRVDIYTGVSFPNAGMFGHVMPHAAWLA